MISQDLKNSALLEDAIVMTKHSLPDQVFEIYYACPLPAVYNEMVVQMNKLGWAATDLQIRPRIRA